jgi:hypothetical protein
MRARVSGDTRFHQASTRGGQCFAAFAPHLREFTMRLALAALAVALPLALSACASAPLAFEPLDGNISGTCHTDMVKGAVGLAAAQPTLERIRVDSDSTALTTGGDAQGVTEGGSSVNVHVGENNAITAISCSGTQVASN